MLDQFIARYRPKIVGKKWYWPLFLNCVRIATVAACRIHVMTPVIENKLDVIGFTRSIVTSLLKNSKAGTS